MRQEGGGAGGLTFLAAALVSRAEVGTGGCLNAVGALAEVLMPDTADAIDEVGGRP